MVQYVDYVQEDPPISGQKYFLVSYAKLNDGSWWQKIRSVWGNMEQAERVARQLSKQDNTFDILVGEVGKWVPALPTADDCERVEYGNERLNELFKGYVEGQQKARDHFEERKALVMKDGLDANLLPEEVIERGAGPPPPMDERALRELAVKEKQDTELDLPVNRAPAWRAT